MRVVALLGDEELPGFAGGQPGVQRRGAEGRVGLAMRGDDLVDVVDQMGPSLEGAVSSSQRKGIDAHDPAIEFLEGFTDGFPIPSQPLFGFALSARPQSLNYAGHEQTSITSFELSFGGIEQRHESIA